MPDPGRAGPASPQQVISDELANTPVTYRAGYEDRGDVRRAWASDILKALAEHGYAVVSVIDPDEHSLPAGFDALAVDVEATIRGNAGNLIAGSVGTVARLIVARLVHVHGLTTQPIPQERT